MATITAVVSTQQSDFPAGTVQGKMRFTLQSANLTGTPTVQDVNDVQATFNDVADGIYIVSAQRLDQYGGNLGDSVTSIPVTVPVIGSGAGNPSTPSTGAVSVAVPTPGSLNVTVS